MKEESTEYITLLMDIKEPIGQDWKEQRSAGQRRYGLSFKKVDNELYDTYTGVFTANTFKTLSVLSGRNKEEKTGATFSLERVQYIFRYFFHDNTVEYGWPNTMEFLSKYEDGKYHPIVDQVRFSPEAIKISNALTASAKNTVDTNDDTPAYLQLAQLAARMKREYIEMNGEMERLRAENKVKEGLISNNQAAMTELRDHIIRLEGILSTKGGDKSAIMNELTELKQKMSK